MFLLYLRQSGLFSFFSNGQYELQISFKNFLKRKYISSQFIFLSNVKLKGSTKMNNKMEFSGWHDCCIWHSWKMLCPSDQPKTHGTFLERTRSTPFCDEIPEFLYQYWFFNVSSLLTVCRHYFHMHSPKNAGIV